MISVEKLIDLIDLKARRSGLSPHSVGRYAGGSGDFYARLVAGHDITTRRAERVAQWLSDHWPADLEWPADIPRLEPNPDREKAA